MALANRNTPLRIQFLEQARAQAKEFAWPALELANTYSPGTRRVDKKKAADEIGDFFAACPSSTDQWAQIVLGRVGTRELQARVAAALRARLATETNPRRLKEYATLWGLEFRARPPQEHDAVRQQVAADLKRLEPLNPKPDAAWLVFLKDGYKQSGTSPETVTAMEDRVIQAFPHSDEAYRIVEARWEKVHKEPEDAKDAAAWAIYNNEYKTALKGWMARFTESRELQHVAPLWAIIEDPDVPAEEGLRTVDDYLAYIGAYERPEIKDYLLATGFMAGHNLQPRRVFDLLRDSDRLIDHWYAEVWGDNLSAEAEARWTASVANLRQVVAESAGCREACETARGGAAVQAAHRTRTASQEL